MTRSTSASRVTAAALLALAVVAPPHALLAQSASSDVRWRAFVGCWAPVTGSAETSSGDVTAPPLVCILPVAGGSSVDFVTVTGGQVATRDRIDATGEPVPNDGDGCKGWRTARWSESGERVYLKSEYSCAGNVVRRSTGLLALSPGGDLIDVQSIGTGSRGAVRVVRSREVAAPAIVATQLATVSTDGVLGTRAARRAAEGQIEIADVVEASHAIDAGAVDAWLVERHAPFAVDGRTLVRLAKAGVPASTTDVLVALAYPSRFAVADPERRTLAIRQPSDSSAGASNLLGMPRIGVSSGTVMDDPYDDYRYRERSRYGRYDSPYSDDPYTSGYDNGYGYGAGRGGRHGYGGGYGGYYGPGGPVIIVYQPGTPTPTPAKPHGRVVKGQGYTQDDASSGSATARPSDAPADPAPRPSVEEPRRAAPREQPAPDRSTRSTEPSHQASPPASPPPQPAQPEKRKAHERPPV